MRVLVVSPHDASPACGVYDHSRRLAETLIDLGHEVRLAKPAELDGAHDYDLVHLHYVPFLYRYWGLGALGLARRLGRQAPMVVTVHEPRIAYELSPRGLLLAGAQDILLQGLLRQAREVIVPTATWLPALRGRPATVIPAGSTLPGTAAPRPADDNLLIGVISPRHPGRMPPVAAAAARTAADRHEGEVVGLGPAADTASIRYTGYLEPEPFADALARCSLLVLPYADGVTGRRTSFISALQVAVPVVTTMRPGMADFPADGFLHADPAKPEHFTELVDRLAGDPNLREELRERGLRLYCEHFAWPILAARTLAVYERARR